MVKDFLLVRAASSVPPGQLAYRDYVEIVHAPRALSNDALASEMTLFNLNHVEGGAHECCLYPSRGMTTVVEHAVGGWAGMARIMADERYLADVRPCERNMVENLMEGEPQFVVIDEERTIFSSGAPGPIRLFDFVRRPATLSRAEFLERLEEDGQWAAEQPQYRSGAAKRVHSIVGQGAAPFGEIADPFDAVVEVWIADAARLAGLADEQRERRAAFCDPDRSLSALTRERRIV